MLFNLPFEGFLHIIFGHESFILLISPPFILLILLSLCSLFNQFMLQLELFHALLSFQLIIKLVDLLILAELFLVVASIVLEGLLVVKVLAKLALLLLTLKLTLLLFYTQLFIKRVHYCLFHVLTFEFVLNFRLGTDLKLRDFLFAIHPRISGRLQ